MKWLITLSVIIGIGVGCATKPPVEEAAYAIAAYTTAVQVATTVVEQTLEKGDVSIGTYEAVEASINGSRMLRESLVQLVIECQEYIVANDTEECPTKPQILAITGSLLANTEGLGKIIDVIAGETK